MTSKVVDEEMFIARSVYVRVRPLVETRHTEKIIRTVVWDNLVGAV